MVDHHFDSKVVQTNMLTMFGGIIISIISFIFIFYSKQKL